MIHTMDCKARVNAQDPDYPTFKKMDCIMHCNANAAWHGGIMDCEATIINVIVTACLSWNQGIRLVITIDDIDVSEALIGNLNIQHNKNMISTFSLNLGDKTYSPRINSNIDLEKVVVITAYINGQEKKIFTGTTDEPSAENTPAFRVIITGRDYGKKLLDKITTVVSVQDLADSTKRNDLIKYLASLAGQTDVDIPEMDEVTIDNSFQDQSIWDMIQKEAMVEQYWIGHNEDGVMELKLDEIKSDIILYPTPDWTYEEDRIIRLGYKKGRVNINKIIISGNTTPFQIPNEGEPNNVSASNTISWGAGENIWEYVGNQPPFSITARGVGMGAAYYAYALVFSYTGNFQFINGYAKVTTGDFLDYAVVSHNPAFQRVYVSFMTPRPRVDVVLEYLIEGTSKSMTYETRYDQVSAIVTDPNSILKYGERDGGSIEYPLLETKEQCIAVGSKIIRDDHSKLGQTYFLIPFNPLIKVGQTIGIVGKDIGLNERYYAKDISHNLDINEGKIKARTQVGGVLYV